jgi:hypothetical protein
MLGFIANDLVTVSRNASAVLVLLTGMMRTIPRRVLPESGSDDCQTHQAIQAQQKLIDDLTARVAALESGKTNEPVAE